MQLECELLEKQWDKEREYEMHMQGMMLSFMHQMMSNITEKGYGSAGMSSHLPYASHATLYMHCPHPSLPNEENM